MANEQLPGEPLSAKGAARRRFTRAGAAASGILLTLHSQPGMAVVCASPSGIASANTSPRTEDPVACSGRSPGIWLQALDQRGFANTPGHLEWPMDPGTLFGSIFVTGREIGLATFQQVLDNNKPKFDPNNLGAHLVAALLNVKAGLSGFQTEDMLVDMWNDLRDYDEYLPNGGAEPWTAEQCVKYLRSTML